MSAAAQSVLVNTFIATSGRAANSALGVVATGLITHSLGVHQFGSYTLLISYAAILQIATDAGLYLTLSRVMAEAPHREQEYISHTIWLRIILGFIVFGLGAGGLLLIPQYRPLLVSFGLVAAGFMFQSISQLLVSIYQKYGVVWRVTIGDLAGRGAHITALLLIGFADITVSTAVIAFTISTAVSLILHYAWVPVQRLLTWSIKWKTWQEIVRVTWPLGLMLLFNAVYFRIDTVILSFFRSPTEVGLYGLAYRIIESSLFFPAMFGGLILPRLTAAIAQNNFDQAEQWLEEALRFVLLAGVATALVLIFLGEPVAGLFGRDFAAAAPYLSILSIALVSMFIGNVFGFTLVALNKGRTLLKLYAFLVIFNVFLNLIFVPRYGAYAAAWTTVITEVTSLTVAATVVSKFVPWRISRILFSPISMKLLRQRP